jgi:hypothetical protein
MIETAACGATDAKRKSALWLYQSGLPRILDSKLWRFSVEVGELPREENRCYEVDRSKILV